MTVTLDARGRDALAVEIVNPLPLRPGPGHSVGTVIPGAGAGLVGLAERVTVAGGHLEHGPTGDGRFRLLAMSVATLEAHVTRVLAKLEVDSRVQVAPLVHDAERP